VITSLLGNLHIQEIEHCLHLLIRKWQLCTCRGTLVGLPSIERLLAALLVSAICHCRHVLLVALRSTLGVRLIDQEWQENNWQEDDACAGAAVIAQNKPLVG
jgi:hypothetical protein